MSRLKSSIKNGEVDRKRLVKKRVGSNLTVNTARQKLKNFAKSYKKKKKKS